MTTRPVVKGVPRILNVNRVPSKPKKRRKVTLVFDEEKRKEFLSGFHKRKVQRRQKAEKELKEKLKEERKRIKQETRKKYKNLVSQREIPELEELLSQQEYETDGKTVSILELNVDNLTQSSNWIGENKPSYEAESSNSGEDQDDNEEIVPGMELTPKKTKKNIVEKDTKPRMPKKAMAKAMQKETIRKTGRSKIFQLKERLDRHKNIKLAQKKKFREERALKNARGKSKKKLARKNKT